ncbi:MAG: MtrB/PioB family decaheme-associated outer membrane protein [Desulfurivibrionaceae bacterium]|nr:MtrB/PioB family decaheme-associated outer membrane protein [Desulfurivibrionaceae bacterium]
MKKTYALASLLLLAPVVAQAQEEAKIESSGEITVGIQQMDVDPDSSKFNKNRDLEDGFNLYDLWFGLVDPNNGRYLDFQGENLLRDDQSIRFGFGSYGSWGVVIDRNEIPHNLSNKARTPYIDQGGGLLTLPSTAPIPNTNLVPSAAQLTANDAATATWLSTTLHGVELGTQRDKTGATISITPHQDFKFRLSLSDERKDGSNLTYGAIGDRPPRTLNAQLAEPIDYKTQELKFEAEYNRPTYQALFTYLLSGFENEIDTLRWQNPYVADVDGNGYDTWNAAYNIAGFGQRALAPDNRYQNASLALGFDLPMASRLSATVAYGLMEQDETLLPYSTSSLGSATAFDSTGILPRTNADAEIDTLLFNADYSINPIERLNLRAFVRYYDLDNKTPQSNWWYVTDDTRGTGNPSYKNKRVNLAYSFDQMNYGLDTSYNLPFWRTTLGLGYEREDIDREFREANTEEDMIKASLKTRPTDWLTVRAKYLYGDRDGGEYNNTVTAQSYWYSLADAGADRDNPQFTFSNHPDMRKFDVSDRERDQFDLAATVMPMAGLDLTGSYRYRKDDYASGVTATQPLLASGIGVAAGDDTAATPGDQLGLLESKTQRYALDISYAATERLNLNAFGSRETIESTQRGLEFNENNKMNPTAVSGAAELGPWTRTTSQWMAVTDDKTNTIGVGAGFEIIPGTLRFATDYTYSQGKVDIDYSGFGTQSSVNPDNTLADTHEFAFRNPETVTHKQYNLNATLEYQFVKNLVFGLHYIYDRYKISDWMQEADTPWAESVGSEYLLRDTSDATSTQWGNRLINLGSYLGPSYEAHFGAVTLTYRF